MCWVVTHEGEGYSVCWWFVDHDPRRKELTDAYIYKTEVSEEMSLVGAGCSMNSLGLRFLNRRNTHSLGMPFSAQCHA